MHNEEKSVVVERFVRSLKNKFYKCMTSISKNTYINKLGYIIRKKVKKEVQKIKNCLR